MWAGDREVQPARKSRKMVAGRRATGSFAASQGEEGRRGRGAGRKGRQLGFYNETPRRLAELAEVVRYAARFRAIVVTSNFHGPHGRGARTNTLSPLPPSRLPRRRLGRAVIEPDGTKSHFAGNIRTSPFPSRRSRR
ncbi:hypothetical protein KM043_017224 [Ampulex compressa]|nr:hypothetical protein KM043_017224 [Ampulex compressa]